MVLYNEVKTNSGHLDSTEACRVLDLRPPRYNAWQSHAPEPPDPLLPQIRELAKMPCYGYRRITASLHRKGIAANHKRILSLMRENGLLCKRKRFKIATTDSKHGLPVYPNLAKNLVVTGLNQLWVADITYIHLVREFIYLAVVLDVFSRKCLGWQLSRNIDAQLCMDALTMAFKERQGIPLNGLVHHSDQGVQYASTEYTDALRGQGVLVSMSRRGNPYDNAFAESFMKTFKVEEVYLSEYESFNDALEDIQRFIEVVYNRKRLHSGIGYLPPAEFEQQVLKVKNA